MLRVLTPWRVPRRVPDAQAGSLIRQGAKRFAELPARKPLGLAQSLNGCQASSDGEAQRAWEPGHADDNRGDRRGGA
jgi:hypothetical protein